MVKLTFTIRLGPNGNEDLKYLTLKELHNLNRLLPDRALIENSTEALKKSSKKWRNIEARGRVLRAQYVYKFK